MCFCRISDDELDGDKWVTATQFLPPLAKAARDSEAESDDDDGDDDDTEHDGSGAAGRIRHFGDDDRELKKKSYWTGLCVVM